MNGYPRLRLNDEQFADQCYWGQDFEPLDMSAEEFASKFLLMKRDEAIECALRLTPRQAVEVIDHLLQAGDLSLATTLLNWPIYGYGGLINDGDLGYESSMHVSTNLRLMIGYLFGMAQVNGRDSSQKYVSFEPSLYNGIEEHLLGLLCCEDKMIYLIVLQDRSRIEPWFFGSLLNYILGKINDVALRDHQSKMAEIGFAQSQSLLRNQQLKEQMAIILNDLNYEQVQKLIELGLIEEIAEGLIDWTSPVKNIVDECLDRGMLSPAEGETRTKRTWAEPLTYHFTRNKES